MLGALAGFAGKALGSIGLGGVVDKVGSWFGDNASNVATGAIDAAAQERANRYQTSERQHAQDFSAKQAATDRQFQSDEAKRQMEFQDHSTAKAMSYSAQQARMQRDYQTKMANTQTQRAAEDMDKAGLNRILALGQPAASPAGAAGQSSSAQGARASGRAASSSGSPGHSPNYAANQIAMSSAKQTIANQKAQKRLIDAQVGKTKAETRGADAVSTIKELLGSPAQLIRDYLGGEGSTGRRIKERLDQIGGSARDKLRTIKINRGNDRDEWMRRHKNSKRQGGR